MNEKLQGTNPGTTGAKKDAPGWLPPVASAAAAAPRHIRQSPSLHVTNGSGLPSSASENLIQLCNRLYACTCGRSLFSTWQARRTRVIQGHLLICLQRRSRWLCSKNPMEAACAKMLRSSCKKVTRSHRACHARTGMHLHVSVRKRYLRFSASSSSASIQTPAPDYSCCSSAGAALLSLIENQHLCYRI